MNASLAPPGQHVNAAKSFQPPRGFSSLVLLFGAVVVVILVAFLLRRCPKPEETKAPASASETGAAACEGWPLAFLTRQDLLERFDQPGWNSLLMAEDPLRILEEQELDERNTPEARVLRLRSLVSLGLGLERAYVAARIAAQAFLERRLEVGVPDVKGADVFVFYLALLEVQVGGSGEPYLSRIPQDSPLTPAVAALRTVGASPIAKGRLAGLERYASQLSLIAAAWPTSGCPYPGVGAERLSSLAAWYQAGALPRIAQLREALKLDSPDIHALSCLDNGELWRATPLVDPAVYGLLALTAFKEALAVSPSTPWEEVYQLSVWRRLDPERAKTLACSLSLRLESAPGGDVALPALLFGAYLEESDLLESVRAACRGREEMPPGGMEGVQTFLERAKAMEAACLADVKANHPEVEAEATRLGLYGSIARARFLEPYLEGWEASLSLKRLAFEHWDGATLPGTLWESREARLAWIAADLAAREYDMAPRQALSLAAAEPLYRPLADWALLAQSAVTPILGEAPVSPAREDVLR